MTQTASVWLVILLAFAAANFPFLTERVLGIVPLARGKNLGQVIATMSLPVVLGPILGPVLGGLILTFASWHWMFWVNVPFCVVGLVLKIGARDAAGFLCLEQRQAAAMDQIVDEGRDEDRLSGARQAGDAEPQRRRDEARHAVRQRIQRNQRVIGKAGQRSQGRVPVERTPDIGDENRI